MTFDQLYNLIQEDAEHGIIDVILSKYRNDRRDFELVELNNKIGYYIELWNSECFTEGPDAIGIPENPAEYIKSHGNSFVLKDILKHKPHNWNYKTVEYISDYGREEFGISIFLFEIK